MSLLREAATAVWSGLNFQRSEAESQQGEADVKMDSSQGKPVQIEVSSQDVDFFSQKEEFSAQPLQKARPVAPPHPCDSQGAGVPLGSSGHRQPYPPLLCSW